MLLNTISIDAAMSVSDVLDRFSRYGLWLNADDPEARAWIAEFARRVGLSVDEAARRLARDPRHFGAAIRRQWHANVLWYSRRADEVLHACAAAPSDAKLLDVLNIHETDSREPLAVPRPGRALSREGVVLDGSMPVAISLPEIKPLQSELDVGDVLSTPRGGTEAPTRPPITDLCAWPRVDAPNYSPAGAPFELTVGLSLEKQPHVAGEAFRIPVAGAKSVDVTVELIADGVDALDGWTQLLRIDTADPIQARAIFRLVGRDPVGPEPVHLTTLEVRYIFESAVCGAASRPLVIGPATERTLAPSASHGAPWLSQPITIAPVTLIGGEQPADLTIELAKPDRNNSNGHYICRLTSPHAIPLDAGPHEIDLGMDARTFAKTEVIDMIRQFSGDPIVDNLLKSIGDLVAAKLPSAVFGALRDIAKRIAPAVPAVLIISAEPYVPWELARMQVPLDPERPPYLGAQTLLGRWFREPFTSISSSGSVAVSVARVEKPPAQPPAAIQVRDMAVMAGMYKAEAGLKRLPAAEQEAATLVQTYDAIPLACSTQALKQLLDATLEHKFVQIGGAGAVHFAGHGDFDPGRPDGSVLFLSNGKPLSSLFFRSANYGGDQQPILFLNACMIGIGGEILGDMGGYPGNCLRGGFGAVLGALWEVDDVIASKVALEFWCRALPVNGKAQAEPVAAILRDLRSKYFADPGGIPDPTYLSYVYYGHPRLKLERRA